MRLSGFARRSALLVMCALVPVLAGCGGNPFNPVIDPGGDGRVPGDTPVNDSPQNLMIRFEKSYEFQDLPTYQKLLTSDFRYTFSLASDPELVNQYPNWGLDDEVQSTQHLFEGFQNTAGDLVPAASDIEMTLTGVQYNAGDFAHSDSALHYQRIVVTDVGLTIVVPGQTEPITYQISARHEFYIVRGDAAVLSEGQEPRTDRWYIRKWDDLSTGISAVARLASINGTAVQRTPVSWGKVKDTFFR